jgi:hypothetical protein
MDEFRKQALKNFPLRLVETTGEKAMAVWQELKSAGGGTPVILGGDGKSNQFFNLLQPFGPSGPNMPPLQPVDDILRAAVAIRFPEDLQARKKADSEKAMASLRAQFAANPNTKLPAIIENGKVRNITPDEVLAQLGHEPSEAPLGEWPDQPDPSPGLSVIVDFSTGKPFEKVYIGIAPTDDWTTIPAWLRWGSWNECPAAEFHVAAMRLWRERYGAELIGINHDTINLRVASKPKPREEALALAHDIYIYCPDIIDQGEGSYSALAAALMANDWWFFWWD